MRSFIMKALPLWLVAAMALQAAAAHAGNPMPPTGSLTLAVGGTAQPYHLGGTPVACLIVNPSTATEQGIAVAEEIWVNPTGTASIGAGGSSLPIEAGQAFPLGFNGGPISWIAATAGHRIAGFCQ